MKSKSIFSDFTKQYALSKTLRFELRPQGDTLKHIKEKGLLKKDEQRAADYKVVKKLIDAYHKAYIEHALSHAQLSDEGLQTFYDAYVHPERDMALLNRAAERLRKEIAAALKYNPLKDEKALIETVVPAFLREHGQEDEAKLVESFKGFTTYFKGFNENRKNIYTDKEQSTAIGFRLVNDNLPKYIDNLRAYAKLTGQHGLDLGKVEEDMAENLYGETLDSFFTLGSFNLCLTQSGIERYNAVLGGRTEQDGTKLQGINEKVNLYRQVAEEKADKRAPFLAPLYKQILSDREQTSYLPEQFEDSNEAVAAIRDFYTEDVAGFETEKAAVHLMEAIEALLTRTLADMEDLNGVWLQSKALTDISQQMFGSWSVLPDALKAHVEMNFKTKKDIEKQEKRSYVSLTEVEHALRAFLAETDTVEPALRDAILAQRNPVADYFRKGMRNVDTGKDGHERVNVFRLLEQRHVAAQPLLKRDWPEKGLIQATSEEKAIIKDYLDSYLHVLHFIKPFHVAPPKKEGGEMPEKDTAFYNGYDELLRHLDATAVPLYNKVRSFMTRKPYSVEKFKLNFENVQLLAGWDVNKEADNTSVILRKDGLYYLAIMDKKHNKVMAKAPKAEQGTDAFEKMNYKLLPGANKMLPKVFFSKSRMEEFGPSDEVLRIRNHATHSKNGTPQEGYEKQDFNLKDCHTLINFFKASIAKHPDWKNFGFSFSPTSNYEDISQFYAEVSEQGYSINFTDVPSTYVDALVKEGKLYLFQLYNKDFSAYSKGRPNLHTLYWKAVFDEENLRDVVFKLNGEAEVFHRPASIAKEQRIVHPKGQAVANKNPENPKRSSTFEYDLVKDRRFTEDKFQFHVPVTLNFKEGNATPGAFNKKVVEALRAYPDVNIIGIDRGERHLAYYTVTDPQGNIKEQGSLNTVTNAHKGIAHSFDYHGKLDEMERKRDASRKSWDAIGNIKQVKEGYLSQVVHKIARLMIDHNAIVVFEDLNFGFKRGRMKVEKQVYQKLEKMLMDKLNHLIFKDAEPTAPGGLLNAYQLSAPFESFKAMGKQTGFIFYIPAANTSKIDPATGFINMLYPKYENEKKAKEFMAKFDGIRYHAAKGWFELVADTNAFTGDKATKVKNSHWTICTRGDRWQYLPTQRRSEPVDVTQRLEKLLGDHGIGYGDGTDLRGAIAAVDSAAFFKELLWLLRLTLQMRYTDDKGSDYLLSPVADAHGVFFDSRQAKKDEPQDPDANGAYHIALKGRLLLHKMKRGDKDLRITGAEWADFVTDRLG